MLVDLVVSLTDAANWEPEPVGRQLERLREEMESLRAAHQMPVAVPVAPIPDGHDDMPGDFFGKNPPPPADEEE